MLLFARGASAQTLPFAVMVCERADDATMWSSSAVATTVLLGALREVLSEENIRGLPT